MQIGFVIEEWSSDESKYVQMPFPADLETYARVWNETTNEWLDTLPLISCKDMFSDVDSLSEREQEMIKNGSCINPETAYVQGTIIFNA